MLQKFLASSQLKIKEDNDVSDKLLNIYEVSETVDIEDYLRAHNIFYTCPRENFLTKVYEREKVRSFSAKGKISVILGSFFQHDIRDKMKFFYHDNKEFYLVGKWICKNCKKTHGDDTTWVLPPGVCSCGSTDFAYGEVSFKNDELYLKGSVDGILKVYDRITEQTEYIVLEIKLIGNTVMKKYEEKFFSADYYYQIQTYFLLSGLKKALFLLINRDAWQSTQIIKTFWVSYDEEVIEKIKKKCIENKEAVLKFVLPSRICSTPLDERAKDCPVVKECFFAANEWAIEKYKQRVLTEKKDLDLKQNQ